MCPPVDYGADLDGQREEAVVEWGELVYGSWALGSLWHDNVRVVHRQAARKLALFELEELVDSSQAD